MLTVGGTVTFYCRGGVVRPLRPPWSRVCHSSVVVAFLCQCRSVYSTENVISLYGLLYTRSSAVAVGTRMLQF